MDTLHYPCIWTTCTVSMMLAKRCTRIWCLKLPSKYGSYLRLVLRSRWLVEVPWRGFTSHPKGFFGSNSTNSAKDKVDKVPFCYYTSLKIKRKDNCSLDREEDNNKQRNITIPYVAGTSEKGFLGNVPVQFNPSNTLRQKHFHSKDKTLRLDSAVRGIEWGMRIAQTCTLGKPDNRCTGTWPNTGEPIPQVRTQQLHLKDRGGHALEDSNVHIWDRDDSLREEEKKPFFCQPGKTDRRGGGLWLSLSATYDAVLRTKPRVISARSYRELHNSANKRREEGLQMLTPLKRWNTPSSPPLNYAACKCMLKYRDGTYTSDKKWN